MNKKELIDKFFEKLLNYADSAEKFAAEQAPKYVEELLSFGALDALVGMVWTGIVSIVFILIVVLMIKGAFKRWEDDPSNYVVSAIVFSILLCLSVSELFSCFLKYKKIEIAPRVYLVEQLKK